MPIQAPPWTEYLSCPVCENSFDLKTRLPITLGCGHSVCKTCLDSLQRAICPFDQCPINIPLDDLPINTALVLLVDGEADLEQFRDQPKDAVKPHYENSCQDLERLAIFLKPSRRQQLSRPMQRKLVTLINCQLLEEEGRARCIRAARSLGERSVTELILQHQNPQQLSANLWAAVRARGCQFLGPAMQEEVLKLVLLALEDGTALSRKVLVMFVVQRLESDYPQASKTSIGHVVQLLYRASCFKVTKRDGDSSLMQLKEEFRSYDTLRREHDAQIVQIATEAGLRIAPDQWSSLLYGDTRHKSHMQSIIDKLQTPQSFLQSVQELVIALQRTGDPGHLGKLRPHLDFLAELDPSPDSKCAEWDTMASSISSVYEVICGLMAFIEHHQARRGNDPNSSMGHSRYKTSMCRDLGVHGSCPRGKHCTFAHSQKEVDQHRRNRGRPHGNKPFARPHDAPSPFMPSAPAAVAAQTSPVIAMQGNEPTVVPVAPQPPMATPIAQVAPLPRGLVDPTAAAIVPNPMVQVFQQDGSPDRFPMLRPVPVYPNQALPLDMKMQQLINAPPPPPMQLHLAPIAGAQPFPMALEQNMYPPMASEHESNMERFPPRDEARLKEMESPVFVSTGMATKSLSALRSRKEEIIDHLHDLVGPEETQKIKIKAEGDVTHPISSTIPTRVVTPSAVSTNCGGGYYSIWTSRSIATIPTSSTTESSHHSKVRLSESVPVSMANFAFDEDDVIPFTDSPQISRFGPISRRSATLMQAVTPSQSQAIISDEPTPTAVVRHSKNMTRQVPSIAALYHQNGSRTTLQPVAVGVNGEIGYIAVPEPSGPSPSPFYQGPMVEPQQGLNMATQQAFLADSENMRMKHELSILQKQISGLNLAHMEQSRKVEDSKARADLAKELHMIESAIKDREREIQVNHLRISTSNGMGRYDDNSGRGISTTATAGLKKQKL